MTREDLYKCRNIEMGIKSSREIYEIKFNQAVKTTQILSDMPKAINKVSDTLEELIDFYNKMIREKEKESKELIMGIERQLALMEDERYVSILRYYYIGGLTIKETAERIGYEEKYTTKLKGDAIDNFETYHERYHTKKG